MIITRTPLRISLGGGGTDLPSYYRHAGGGFLIAAAITKYVYISVHRNFEDDILLKYSRIEKAPSPADVATPAAPRSPAGYRCHQGRRDLVDGGHTGGHRPWLLGRVHRGGASCSSRIPAPFRLPTRRCRGRLSDRDRTPGRAGGQAGPVHRRCRWRHRLRLQSRRHGRSDPRPDGCRRGGTARGRSPALLHGHPALRLQGPVGPGRTHTVQRRGDAEEPRCRPGARARRASKPLWPATWPSSGHY